MLRGLHFQPNLIEGWGQGGGVGGDAGREGRRGVVGWFCLRFASGECNLVLVVLKKFGSLNKIFGDVSDRLYFQFTQNN